MSRSLDQRCYYTRWSEPILHRHRPIHLGPTSEDDTSSIRRSRSSSPLLTVSHPPIPPLEPPESCCTCNCQYNRKKSSTSYTNNESKKSSGIRSGSQRMRESLELQLIGTQVEEALAGDRQAALLQHLDLATSALESLMQHVRSLQVSHIAAYRTLDLTHRLVLPYYASSSYSNPASADLSTHLQQAEIQKEHRLSLLRDVIECCSKNVATSKQLQNLMDEHRIRREDFSVAARNFKNLLDNSKLTVSQMEKLHRQYDAILNDYQQSRRVLDTELPKVVRMRLGALRQSFQMIAEFYEDSEYGKQTANLFRVIGDNLYQEEEAANKAKNALLNDQSPVQDVCQKCKVNRVDKK